MDTRSASPTIAYPGPGIAFEDWMTATDVFDAIEHTQRRCGDKTAVTFIASDPDAPTRKLSYTELLEGIGRTANALRMGVALRRTSSSGSAPVPARDGDTGTIRV